MPPPPDPRTREASPALPGLAELFICAQTLDMAVVSVGDLTPHSVRPEYGLLAREEVALLEAAGAVGDLLCHVIEADGNVSDDPVNDRVVAVTPLSLGGTRRIARPLAGGTSWR